jgi:dolichol-phosphate mannosyltransferase
MRPELSIVVPFYNEEENVSPLVDGVIEAIGQYSGGIELILVDDCSTDTTWERIKNAHLKDKRVRGIRHLRNKGQSAALWTGFGISQGNIIGTLDGDLQNDPADLPAMLRELATCDLVCGVRTKRADNFLRRASSIIARRARKLALRMDFADTGCNLRVFKKSVLETVPAFDGLHRFMPVLAHSGGATVKEMPVRHHPRVAGQSKYGVWNRLGRGIRDLLMVGLFIRRQLKSTNATFTAHRPETELLAEEDKPSPVVSV